MNATARVLPKCRRIADEVRNPLHSLRRSLDGQWGLLFSDADDFGAYGFEADRWLAHVRAAFAMTEIRPIALADGRHGGASTWIAALGGLTMHLCIDEIRRSALAQDELAGAHVASTLVLERRYVLLLDDTCRVRWSLRYSPNASLPSPIDLAALAEAKRRECENRSTRSRSGCDRNSIALHRSRRCDPSITRTALSVAALSPA